MYINQLINDNGKLWETMGRKATGPFYGSQLPKGEFTVRKYGIIVFLIFTIIFIDTIGVYAYSDISIDINKAKEGIVKVSYGGINKKTKVMVEKGLEKYYYDLNKEEDCFPLQFGQGNYTVAVLENTSGNNYKVLSKKTFNADIKDENEVYLKSAQPVIWNENMKAIKFAKTVSQDKKTTTEIVQALYDYIVDNVKYDYVKIKNISSDYIPNIETIFKEGKGMCYDYSALFGAMLRSCGIPAKLVKGYKDDIKDYHAWNEVYMDGDWVVIDTTYDVWLLENGTSYSMIKDAKLYKKVKEY